MVSENIVRQRHTVRVEACRKFCLKKKKRCSRQKSHFVSTQGLELPPKIARKALDIRHFIPRGELPQHSHPLQHAPEVCEQPLDVPLRVLAKPEVVASRQVQGLDRVDVHLAQQQYQQKNRFQFGFGFRSVPVRYRFQKLSLFWSRCISMRFRFRFRSQKYVRFRFWSFQKLIRCWLRKFPVRFAFQILIRFLIDPVKKTVRLDSVRVGFGASS